jgi:hypothetical protein
VQAPVQIDLDGLVVLLVVVTDALDLVEEGIEDVEVGDAVGNFPEAGAEERRHAGQGDSPASAVVEDSVLAPVDRDERAHRGPFWTQPCRLRVADVAAVVVHVDVLEQVLVGALDRRDRDRGLLEQLAREAQRVLVLVGALQVAVDLLDGRREDQGALIGLDRRDDDAAGPLPSGSLLH